MVFERHVFYELFEPLLGFREKHVFYELFEALLEAEKGASRPEVRF